VSEEKHLSGEQIDRLMEAQLGGAAGHVQDGLLNTAQDHLAACATCQKLVAMYQEFYRALSRVGRATSGSVTSNCPSERSLNEFAAGVTPVEQQGIILSHVIECDRCGDVFRTALEIFSHKQDPTERQALAELESGTDGWQKGVARELASQVKRKEAEITLRPKLGFMAWPRWASAALVSLTVVLLLGFSLIWLQPGKPNIARADRLLVQSYGERRTMRTRFPGAPFSQSVEQRGSTERTGSFSGTSQSLREAEPIIAAGLRRNADDPAWLQLKARADLLDGHAVPAIFTLELALSKRPTDLSLKTDLASAYFENGDSTRALTLLDAVVDSDPANAVAQFNRAIVLNALGKYNEAASAWTRYLQVDPNGEWSPEARDELTKARALAGGK
jgi:tetratricopeptide (TPR) repeat protein